jgi:hypothetical protein
MFNGQYVITILATAGAAVGSMFTVATPENLLAASSGIPSTGQGYCYDDDGSMECPSEGEAFYGQDAQYSNYEMSYVIGTGAGTGTVYDQVTGLTWEKAHHDNRLTYYDAKSYCENLSLGGRTDWRLPTITELFSLADFDGKTGSQYFIDADYFDMAYPDESILANESATSTHTVDMMGQTWSSTIYRGDHWDNPNIEAAFFFNFLDGRIKQAPTSSHTKGLFYRCVSGGDYDRNILQNNGNGTVTDYATGMMWQQSDDGVARNWGESLAYCENSTAAGYDDWRLPDAKELQSIVDYNYAVTAIDAKYFTVTNPDAWFWSSTTHKDGQGNAVYICFGECTAADGTDTHGAGAQRSDPKAGDPSSYTSRGDQKDDIRIYNYARCVRDDSTTVVSVNGVDGRYGSGSGTIPGTATGTIPGTGSATGNMPQPPEMAFQACSGKSADSNCQINTPQGQFSGICRNHGNQLACIPNN